MLDQFYLARRLLPPMPSVSSGSQRLLISGVVADAGGQTLLIPKHPLPFPNWLCLTVAQCSNCSDYTEIFT